MKRWTSWLLATVLTAFLLSCGGKTALDILAVPAEASIWDFWKNKKTTEISSAEDLEKLRKNPEGRFVLTQDITVQRNSERKRPLDLWPVSPSGEQCGHRAV